MFITDAPLLTKEEELELGHKAFNGDIQAQHMLVNANFRFVLSVAYQYRGLGLDTDDLIGEASIGAVEASKKYNPEKKVKFITFAVWYVRNAILKALTRQNLKIEPEELEEHEDKEVPIRRLEWSMRFLNAKERYIIMEHFGLQDRSPKTLSQIANELAVTAERVRQIEREAKAKLLHILTHTEF